jgi:hypothetical protein
MRGRRSNIRTGDGSGLGGKPLGAAASLDVGFHGQAKKKSRVRLADRGEVQMAPHSFKRYERATIQISDKWFFECRAKSPETPWLARLVRSTAHSAGQTFHPPIRSLCGNQVGWTERALVEGELISTCTHAAPIVNVKDQKSTIAAASGSARTFCNRSRIGTSSAPTWQSP